MMLKSYITSSHQELEFVHAYNINTLNLFVYFPFISFFFVPLQTT